MSRMGRAIAALERRPWALAALAAAGVTLLLPAALALLGPPELLDAAVAQGDARLGGGLLALFAASLLLGRVLLRRRRLAEEKLDEEPPRARVEDKAPAAGAAPGPVDERPAKSYLR